MSNGNNVELEAATLASATRAMSEMEKVTEQLAANKRAREERETMSRDDGFRINLDADVLASIERQVQEERERRLDGDRYWINYKQLCRDGQCVLDDNGEFVLHGPVAHIANARLCLINEWRAGRLSIRVSGNSFIYNALIFLGEWGLWSDDATSCQRILGIQGPEHIIALQMNLCERYGLSFDTLTIEKALWYLSNELASITMKDLTELDGFTLLPNTITRKVGA